MFYARNPWFAPFKAKQRKLAKEHRTPKWANEAAIKTLYIIAVKLGWEVDHEIPLRGKLVSGLHVENNLRVVRPKENGKKSNKYDILGELRSTERSQKQAANSSS